MRLPVGARSRHPPPELGTEALAVVGQELTATDSFADGLGEELFFDSCLDTVIQGANEASAWEGSP